MNPFVRENSASLTTYFHKALEAREIALMSADSGFEWASDAKERERLCSDFAPVLATSNNVLTGVHAHAFVFDAIVVKTNLFGQYYYDGQRQWLEWCVQNQGNPLVPKIAMLLSDPDSDRFLVVMERLTIHSGFHHHTFRKEIDTAFRSSFDRQPMTAYPKLSEDLAAIKRNSTLAVAELKADIELMVEIGDAEVEADLKINLLEHEIALQYIEEIENFWTSLRTVNSVNYEKIRSFWDGLVDKKHDIDVHSLNWMLRSNGEQVFLDPVN